MYKCALVFILIFSNIAPLLAWGAIRPSGFGRKTTPRVAQALRKGHATVHLRRLSYNVTKCVTGSCVYPPMCHCPVPDVRDYVRYTEDNAPWYYNSTSRKCQRSDRALYVCNSFTDEQHCKQRCANAKNWSPDVIKSHRSAKKRRA
uniref:Putative monolaris n=1 Tax=Rhipicephalus pulchellus TaxID=72859 RepID=L7LQB8_RHIPC